MPTSTATITLPTASKHAKLPASAKKSTKSAVTTLRSLYPRAARAFLQRDVLLTHSLLLSAFSNLHSPASHIPDPLVSHRRKWDILRITLETTLYSSGQPTKPLPEALRSILMLPPPSLLATMHTRSLQLFTPTTRGKPSAEFLPAQILVTLVLASVKLECVRLGREMVKDWLARRSDSYRDEKLAAEDAEGYEKVLEVYCLHVLPRLDDWDYARDFLQYETELPRDKRLYLVESLQLHYAQHLAQIEEARQRTLAPPSPSTSSDSSSRTPTPRPNSALNLAHRSPSPSPSIASTSTTSTHTAVPLTPRPIASVAAPTSRAQTSFTPASISTPPSPSTSRTPIETASQNHLSTRVSRSHGLSQSTITPSNLHSHSRTHPHGHTLARPPSAPPIPTTPLSASISPPSLLALLKTTFIPHMTRANLTFLVLMFLVPVLSFVIRLRRRRGRGAGVVSQVAGGVAVGKGVAEETRRRLRKGWWAEIRKSVVDTIKMAGSGLV